MARKSLNKSNLVALGAEALADLLLEAVKGDAARQRRVRMALSADLGVTDVAADLRKRFASLRRAQSFISWRAQAKLARELTELIGVVDTRIAPEAPDTAFDLLWSLLQLTPSIHERTDDSNGTIGGVFADAMNAIGQLAPRLTQDPVVLADSVFDALLGNGYGEYDGAVMALAEALGEPGLGHLKLRAEVALSAELSAADLARYDFVDDPERQASLARDSRDLTAKMILQDVADLQGDVDAWLSRYSVEQLTYHTIATDAAQRLLAVGRPEEALKIVENCLAQDDGRSNWFDKPDLDDAHFACLEALGREEALRQALWARFERWLSTDTLRRYLKRLPDFEDEEALDRAKERVLAHPSLITGLAFCLNWPDIALAAQLVETRAAALDGEAYEVLTPAADALEAEYPLAAVLVWRSMIRFALERARSKRYGHAARHLGSCAAADAVISDYGAHADHATFLQGLREAHGRKSAFWSRVA